MERLGKSGLRCDSPSSLRVGAEEEAQQEAPANKEGVLEEQSRWRKQRSQRRSETEPGMIRHWCPLPQAQGGCGGGKAGKAGRSSGARG